MAAFAEDVAIRRYGEASYNIVHWSDFDRGGHFAAMEVPDLLVGDVRDVLPPPALSLPAWESWVDAAVFVVPTCPVVRRSSSP